LADPTVKEIKLAFTEETIKNILSFLYLDRVENLSENAGDLFMAAKKVKLHLQRNLGLDPNSMRKR
jgi:hypothetical protein